MNKCLERLYNGLLKENPTFVLMLGMCPTLAVTTSAMNGLGMGLSAAAVLITSVAAAAVGIALLGDYVRLAAMFRYFFCDAIHATLLLLLLAGAAMVVFLPEKSKNK